MGEHRDRREPRRRRYDEPGSFSEGNSEPSYFQSLPPSATSPVDAEVIWFNASKGFGFVKLANDTEVYLHARVVERAGSSDVSEGTRLRVTLQAGPRGQQVSQIIEIGDQIAKMTLHARGDGGPVSGADAELENEGTVKWYNPEKGFGFIAPDNGEKDIFVHATALSRSGLSLLVEGQKVIFQSGQGKKGLEVRSMRLC